MAKKTRPNKKAPTDNTVVVDKTTSTEQQNKKIDLENLDESRIDPEIINQLPDEDPKVEEVNVEEVSTQETKTEESSSPINLDLVKIKPEQRLSGDGYARLLDVAERHISKMKPGEASTIKMEQAFTYNLAWAMTKASIQAREEKMELGIKVPNDDIIVNDIIETFNNLGVALAPSEVSEDKKQLTLSFKEIDKETETAAKEEIALEVQQKIEEAKNLEEQAAKKITIPVKKAKKDITDDPTSWENDDEAKIALANVLINNKIPFPNRFNECLLKVKQYRQNQEPDAEKKLIWDQIKIGALFKDAISILGNKSTVLLRGLCQCTVGSLINDHNPIFAHATIKYNLPVLSEEEIADLLKAFIEVRNADKKQPIDETLAVKNGILEPDRQFFLDVPTLSATSVRIQDEAYTRVCQAKKIMNKFIEAYGMFDKTDPKYKLKVTNKMIEIRNLYVDKNAQFALYTEDEYPKTLAVAS